MRPDWLIILAAERALPLDLGQITRTYESWGYSGGIKPEDTAWLALSGDELVGIVRVAPEKGTLVLRGMCIAEGWQRQGIGKRLLDAIAVWLENRECYCVPYNHLLAFYGRIGFIEIPADVAPAFLATRLREYTRRGLHVTVMCRSPSIDSCNG